MKKKFETRKRDIVSMNGSLKKLRLHDVHVASSYNTCRAGGARSTKVAYYPIHNALLQGARFLDFEIYHLDGRAVVAASDKARADFKTTTNCLPLAKVLKEVDNMAFAISTDPLFLNFRIKASNETIGDLIINDINNQLDKTRLLSCAPTCSPDAIPSIELGNFEGKYIIICNKPEGGGAATSTLNMFLLDNNRINISDLKTEKLWNIRREGILEQEKGQTQRKNRDKLCIVYPNLAEGVDAVKNVDGTLYMSGTEGSGYGAQFVAMNYQTYDDNLKEYINYFEGHSFIEKHIKLKYEPIIVQIELEDEHPLDNKTDTELIPGVPGSTITMGGHG